MIITESGSNPHGDHFFFLFNFFFKNMQENQKIKEKNFHTNLILNFLPKKRAIILSSLRKKRERKDTEKISLNFPGTISQTENQQSVK